MPSSHASDTEWSSSLCLHTQTPCNAPQNSNYRRRKMNSSCELSKRRLTTVGGAAISDNGRSVDTSFEQQIWQSSLGSPWQTTQQAVHLADRWTDIALHQDRACGHHLCVPLVVSRKKTKMASRHTRKGIGFSTPRARQRRPPESGSVRSALKERTKTTTWDVLQRSVRSRGLFTAQLHAHPISPWLVLVDLLAHELHQGGPHCINNGKG